MKYVAFFLLLLTLGGAAMPCCVEETSCATATEEGCCALPPTCEQDGTVPHGEENEPHRPCSPFFACGSCGGSVPQPLGSRVTFAPVSSAREHIGFTKVIATQEAVREDWKPPQGT